MPSYPHLLSAGTDESSKVPLRMGGGGVKNSLGLLEANPSYRFQVAPNCALVPAVSTWSVQHWPLIVPEQDDAWEHWASNASFHFL